MLIFWFLFDSELSHIERSFRVADVQVQPSQTGAVRGGQVPQTRLHCSDNSLKKFSNLSRPSIRDATTLKITNPVVQTIRETTQIVQV